MRISVYVNKKDIESGVRGNAESCPVANALYRKYSRYVSVGSYATRIGDGYWVNSPKTVTFIEDFDRGNPVKPFTARFS